MSDEANPWQPDPWVAYITITPMPDGYRHATIKVHGKSSADAEDGTKIVMESLAKGRKTFIRAEPQVHSETDFETKTTRHAGYARFSFSMEQGEWVKRQESIPVGLKYVDG